MKRKPLLGNLLVGLLAFVLMLVVWVLAALRLTSAAAGPPEFPFNLQSNLDADYGPDPIGARFYELRLSIVGEMVTGAQGESLQHAMGRPVPYATPRPQGASTAKGKTKSRTDRSTPNPRPTKPASPCNRQGPAGRPQKGSVAPSGRCRNAP